MMTPSQYLPIATNWIMLSRLCKDTYVLSGIPEHMHYWDWENWQGAALMVGHQATTDFPHAGGNWQSAASMESRSNSKLFTSMQCSNTPKKATTASCSVVWVAKFNGPLHPLALVI
ncbi:unnamed protein product [Musa banksii]